MAKIQRPVTFIYNLKKQVVINLRLQTEYLKLAVKGIGYNDSNYSKAEAWDKWTFDCEQVLWNGVDVKELLEFSDMMEEIENQGAIETARVFENEKEAA